jgi:calcineurin-like phosphoesterase family protein
MSEILITADEHYGHKKIIVHCSRPSSYAAHIMGCTLHRCHECSLAIEEQTERIIERHNRKVPNSKGYLTIHVGDLFWHTLSYQEAMAILRRLNGRHGFLFGNHDELVEKYHVPFAEHFDFIRGANKAGGAMILHHNKHEMTLNHFAQRRWKASHKGSWMLYGHSHNELPVVGKSFDIGVDGHDFEPWTLEEIEAKMETLPNDQIIKKPWPGKQLVGSGSTVHSHVPGETCGFCRLDPRTKL